MKLLGLKCSYWQKFLTFRAFEKGHLKRVLLCQKYYQSHYYNYLLILNLLAVLWSSIKSSVRILSEVHSEPSQTSKMELFVKRLLVVNPWSANLTKWSNTLKQVLGNLPMNCLSVFDHFMGLALKGFTIFANVWLGSEYAPTFENTALLRFYIFTSQSSKMVRHTSKILQHLLQAF